MSMRGCVYVCLFVIAKHAFCDFFGHGGRRGSNDRILARIYIYILQAVFAQYGINYVGTKNSP